MRPDRLWLSDILAAAAAVQSFLTDQSEEDFLEDNYSQSAVLYQLTIIGEAASRVSSDLRQQHPEIRWRTITGFRNRIVHAYFALDWSIVWDAAVVDVPELALQIATILDQLPRSD